MIGFQEIAALGIVFVAACYLTAHVRTMWLKPKTGCGGGCSGCPGATEPAKLQLLTLDSQRNGPR